MDNPGESFLHQTNSHSYKARASGVGLSPRQPRRRWCQGWLQDEESRGSPCSPLAWRILLPGFALAAEHAECWAALLIQNQTETALVSGLCPGVSSCCRFLSPVTRNEEGTPFPLVQCDGSGFFRCSSTAQLPPALPTPPVDLAKPSARRAGAV